MSQSKSYKSKPNQTRAKADIAFTNIRGLRTNFLSVKAYAQTMSPHLLTLSETGLDPSVSTRNFNIPGHCPLIVKHDQLNRHGHGLGAYVREGLPCGRDLSHEDANSPYMCFRLALLHTTAFIFTLYRPQEDGCHVLDQIANQIDKILVEYPSANMFTTKSG